METFQILHLAASWPTDAPHASQTAAPPLSGRPATPAVSDARVSALQSPPADVHAASKDGVPLSPRPRIRAAAAQIVFAARDSREFITPEEVNSIENWCGRGVLEALADFEIALEVKIFLFACVSGGAFLTIITPLSAYIQTTEVYGSKIEHSTSRLYDPSLPADTT